MTASDPSPVGGQALSQPGPPRWASTALVVAALTLTSRVFGFGRSLVFSKTVGDTCLGDAYNAANTLPNTLFEIVAGGVLAGVVVPVVARHVGATRRAEAAKTVSALLTWTLLVLSVPALAVFAGASAYAEAFTQPECPGSASVLAALLVMFAPQIWLYGLAVVSAGVLQAHHRFVAAAAGPLVSSVLVIVAYLAFGRLVGTATGADLGTVGRQGLLVLGLGTTAGVLALALTTTIPLVRLGLGLRPAVRFAPGDGQVVGAIAAAGIVGLVLQQLSVLLITWRAANSGDPGALTRYVWASAIYLLPYAVLAAPLLQLAFPRLSAAAERGADAVSGVLADTGPLIVLAGCLGAALLPSTAVPVARIFVLGPGSENALALALVIMAFAPAVLAYTVFGLTGRVLLARHQARRSGLVGVVAWGGVIVSVGVAYLTLPDVALVAGLAGAMSAGLGCGAVTGWLLVRHGGVSVRPLRRPLAAGVVAAVVAAILPTWWSFRFAQSGAAVAFAGAIGCTLACLLAFLAVVAALDRPSLRRLRSMRAGGTRSAAAP